MSASTSSPSPVSSPQNRNSNPKGACVECRRLKRGCDKQLPCGNCSRSNRDCDYRDPSDDGIFSPIHAAKDINSLAFGTLMDILVNKPRTKEAVSLYFEGVNTWFTVVERASFERHLDTAWGDLSAEASVLTLCMALVARPPNQKPSKGIGDSIYVTSKMLLSGIESKIGISTHLLQAELLIAMYEISHAMRYQAWLSVGRCLDRTKALGWFSKAFWTATPPRFTHGQLKLYSILCWAIVYVDCLLYVGYEDQAYPLLTADLFPDQVIPLPELIDQYLSNCLPFQSGGQGQGFWGANSDFIGGTVFPEARSAMYLSLVLRHLMNPTLETPSRGLLSDWIVEHTRNAIHDNRDAAVGANLIALMKLHYPDLFSGIGPMPLAGADHAKAVKMIKISTTMVHGKAEKLTASDERLTTGAVAPCWAFALCYASRLLVPHGDGVLQDAGWLSKVKDMKNMLDKISKRWKIAEKYREFVRIDLDNRLAPSVR